MVRFFMVCLFLKKLSQSKRFLNSFVDVYVSNDVCFSVSL